MLPKRSYLSVGADRRRAEVLGCTTVSDGLARTQKKVVSCISISGSHLRIAGVGASAFAGHKFA